MLHKINLKISKDKTTLSDIFLVGVVLLVVVFASSNVFVWGVVVGMWLTIFYHIFHAIEQGFRQGYVEAKEKHNQQTDLPCDDCWKIPERHCCWWNEEDDD